MIWLTGKNYLYFFSQLIVDNKRMRRFQSVAAKTKFIHFRAVVYYLLAMNEVFTVYFWFNLPFHPMHAGKTMKHHPPNVLDKHIIRVRL